MQAEEEAAALAEKLKKELEEKQLAEQDAETKAKELQELQDLIESG